jgi:hypothetical protein
MQSLLPFVNDSLTVRFIQNAFDALKQTLVQDNVMSEFRMPGLDFDEIQTPNTLLFREEKLRHSQGFREIWEAHYPLDQLSKRCREARCGSIKMSKLKQSSFSISLRTKSEDICN